MAGSLVQDQQARDGLEGTVWRLLAIYSSLSCAGLLFTGAPGTVTLRRMLLSCCWCSWGRWEGDQPLS
eukprot:33987-Chlamydomonas_euryale.AAC.1